MNKGVTSETDKLKELKDRYIEYFKELPVQKYAAMYVGRNEDTIIDWRKTDSDFSDRVDLARAEWVKRKASKAKVEFALERLEKQIFKESKEIEVTVPVPLADLTDVRNNDSLQQDKTS